MPDPENRRQFSRPVPPLPLPPRSALWPASSVRAAQPGWRAALQRYMRRNGLSQSAAVQGIDDICRLRQIAKGLGIDADRVRQPVLQGQGEGRDIPRGPEEALPRTTASSSVLIMCDGEGNLATPTRRSARRRSRTTTGGSRRPSSSAATRSASTPTARAARGADEARRRRPAQAVRVRRHARHQRDRREPRRAVVATASGWRGDQEGRPQARRHAAGLRQLPDPAPHRSQPRRERESYDLYVRVKEMMPQAKGVRSVKPTVWDFKGNSGQIDLPRMMTIVVDAGYHGYCGSSMESPARAGQHSRTAPAARSDSRSARSQSPPFSVRSTTMNITRRESRRGTGHGRAARRGRARIAAGPEPERQVEHRVHRLRRPRNGEPRRARHHAGAQTQAEAGAESHPAARIRTRTSSSSATSTRPPWTPRRSGSRRPEELHRSPPGVRQPERLRRRHGVDRRAHARVRDLSGADARQARLLREAAHPQHLGSAADSRDRREVPEAVHADGQPGPRLGRSGARSRRYSYRRDRAGARSARLGGSRVGAAGCRVRREVRQAARLLQRHPDHRPVQGRDAGPADTSLGSVDRARARAAVPRDVFPGTALVSLVGLRQRHDERPRRPRQRRAVHRAGHQAAADDRSHVAEWAGRAPGTGAGDDDRDL